MDRIRIGVVGCGAIAQVQHLPHIAELRDRYELAGLCDASAKLVDFIGEMYDVPDRNRVTRYEDLLALDLDAVLLCFADPKTDAAVTALDAGKHVFIEKPMCYSVREADRIIGAAEASGKTLMVGYMKQHDPGYRFARDEVLAMPDIRFIQANHLHCGNDRHLSEYTLYAFDDIPPDVIEDTAKRRERAVREAIGDVPEAARRIFFSLSGSMIHDISSLRGLFGPPQRVVSAEVWRGGSSVTTVLAYENDARCVATWTSLPELHDFRETLEVFGAGRRVGIRFPTGFDRGLPSPVTVMGMDGEQPWKKELVVNKQNAFKLELIHFHDCVVNGKPPITDGYGARQDHALCRDIVHTYMRANPS
ncbi:MAG: Gfo/Idh/MocA family oxidoreductase [Gemmatimonadetes bacterium]|nr:Gfo/Idh/MocA family oxidoreductase [Gemmatimonadota bacterium]